MRSCLFVLAFLLFYSIASAQSTALRGTIRDSISQHPLGFVSVGLLRLPDSVSVEQVATNEQGQFAFAPVPAGRYLIKTNLVGYVAVVKAVQLPQAAASPVEITLKPGDNVLQEVTVQEQIIPIMLNGDTVVYNAGAFQVKENAVAEDLLKKLPGVEVDRQGNIKAMGQDVRQVLVDGKPFFGNDPKAATKNLPADAIDQVKVYDKRSDQSTFSGFDDGSGEKVVDIRLKADRRKGKFGRFTGGYGTDERYTGSAMYNKFSPKEQLSLMGSANNVNDFGFSFEEMLQSGLVSVNGGGGVGDGDGESVGGVVMRGSGGSIGAQQPGIAKSYVAGLNYWRNVSSKLAVDGNLLLNGADTRLEQQLWRQNFFPDSTVDYRQNTNNRDQRLNPRLRFEADWKVDSFNTLNLKTNGSYTTRQTDNLRDYTFGLTGQRPFLSGINRLNQDIDRSRANATLLWKHNFRKKGHTFSTQIQAVLQPAHTISYNDFLTTDTLFQRAEQEESNRLLTLKSSYTRPLRKRNRFVEMTYSAAQSHWDTDKNTFDFDPDAQEYNVRNAFFSNGLVYDFFNQQLGANYRRQRLRYDYGFGFATQYSYLNASTSDGTSAAQKHFFHFLPNANARFTLNKTAHLNFRLQSAIQPPAARYLLPAPDNTNPQTLRISNPDLRPEQRYSLQTNYQNFKIGALSTLMGTATIAYIRDRISSDIARSTAGQQIIQPINTTGGLTATAFGMWSTPILHRKLRFSANINNIINAGYGFLDGEKNENRFWMKGGGLRLSYEKNDRYFVEIGSNINHNYNKNAASIPSVSQFWSQALESGGEVSLPKGWKINADLSWNRYLGQSTANNTDFLLINGSIGKRFLKKEAGFLEIVVQDALKQNVGVVRTPGDGYLEEISNRILQRYVLLKFTYRLMPKGAGGPGGPGSGGVKIRF